MTETTEVSQISTKIAEDGGKGNIWNERTSNGVDVQWLGKGETSKAVRDGLQSRQAKGVGLHGFAVGKKPYLSDKGRLLNSKVLFRAHCPAPCVDLPSSEGRERTLRSRAMAETRRS